MKSIGAYAFYSCDGFSGTLKLPAGVTEIGLAAFDWCSGFTGDLIIPNSVKVIGDYAFNGCNGFTGNLVIPASVESIGKEAFSSAEFDGDIVIAGNSAQTLGGRVFYGCKGRSLILGDGWNKIPSRAFEGAFIGGDLVIPASVTTIEDYAFYNCNKFTGLTIPASVTTINGHAFSGCSGFSGQLVIPAGVTQIEEYVFSGCSGFTGQLVIPAGVTKIKNYAFQACSSFTELVIPSGVEWIGKGAFYDCDGFTGQLVIPNSVTAIYERAFYNCSGFTGELVIPDSMTQINESVFYNCSGFTGLTIPNSITKISAGAFSGCTGLTGELVIPNSVTELAGFGGCTGLTGLVIPNSVTKLSGFSGCTGLTGELVIPDSVREIGIGAFSGCTGLTGDLIIPNSVTNIYQDAFSGCTGFTGDLIIPNSVTVISSFAFEDCTGFTGDLVIPAGVGTICRSAFEACTGFTGDLVVGAKNIESGAFYNCTGFTKLTMCDGVELIDSGAFYGCSGLQGDLIIPSSVKSVGTTAYYGNSRSPFSLCDGFTRLIIQGNEKGNNFSSFYYFPTKNIAEIRFEGTPRGVSVNYGSSVSHEMPWIPEGIPAYYPSCVDGWDEVIAVNPEVNWVMYELPVVSFVRRMYEVALNRSADEGGLKNWVTELLSGNKTGAEVAYCFIFSEEFKEKNYCNEHYIMQLYKAFMGREYDAEGLNYWLDVFKSGSTREAVFNGFSQSNEFRGICESYGIELGTPIDEPQYGTVPTGPCSIDGKDSGVASFIKRLYKICLDREADENGLSYWSGRLLSRECTGTTAAHGFVFSEEFINKNHSDADYIEYLYQAFMGRASEANGKAYWLGRMASGEVTREDVFNGFAYSAEFVEICNGYGIAAY